LQQQERQRGVTLALVTEKAAFAGSTLLDPAFLF